MAEQRRHEAFGFFPPPLPISLPRTTLPPISTILSSSSPIPTRDRRVHDNGNVVAQQVFVVHDSNPPPPMPRWPFLYLPHDAHFDTARYNHQLPFMPFSGAPSFSPRIAAEQRRSTEPVSPTSALPRMDNLRIDATPSTSSAVGSSHNAERDLNYHPARI